MDQTQPQTGTPEQKSKKNNTPKIAVGVVSVAVAGSLLTWALTDKQSTTGQNANHQKYKNGTFNATGHYRSPAGEEVVEISLSLKDGIIADATFIPKATNRTSKRMQGMFGQGFKEAVLGKAIDQLSLTVVNGSSLTPKGFMNALEQIKKDAANS